MVPRDSTASTSSPPPGSYHSPWMSATRHSESPPQPARSHRPRSPASGTPRQVLAVQHAHRGRAKGGEPRSAIPTQSKCFPSHAQILQAHARKVPVSSSVDFDSLARATGGFWGPISKPCCTTPTSSSSTRPSAAVQGRPAAPTRATSPWNTSRWARSRRLASSPEQRRLPSNDG